jgi:hypothetical protein
MARHRLPAKPNLFDRLKTYLKQRRTIAEDTTEDFNSFFTNLKENN